MGQTAENDQINAQNTAMTDVTDEAVGVAKSKWYVAIVPPRHEKKIEERLVSVGYETFVATQQRLRVYASGRKKWVTQVLIPAKIFIRCTDKERRTVLQNPFVLRFMTNPTGNPESGHRPLAVISPQEIDTLKFMLGQRDFPVSFIELKPKSGDPVKIIRGSLKGLEGHVFTSPENLKEVVVTLDLLGCAKVTVPVTDLELLKK